MPPPPPPLSYKYPPLKGFVFLRRLRLETVNKRERPCPTSPRPSATPLSPFSASSSPVLTMMGGEDKHKHHHHHNHHHRLLSFHFHMPHLGHGHGPRKGWMGIRVGQEGEEQQRFVVPVEYLNHPLFVGLLDQAREVYGFEHQGAITIPCEVDHFRHVRGIIDRDTTAHHHLHLPHFAGCFRA